MVSTRVCPGRKRPRRGTRLGGWDKVSGVGKADDDEARSCSSSETLRTREGGDTKGKWAGNDAHLHAELQQWAGAMERRRPRAWRRRRHGLGLRGKETAAAGCAEPRAQGGSFIGPPRALACGPRAARGWRLYRATAGLGLEPDSGSRSRTTPTGGSRLSASERRGGGSWRARGPLGSGERNRSRCWAGPRGGGGRKKKSLAGLGRTGREGERDKEKERVAGPKEKN
jgi:hypothetical protein